MAQNRFDPTVIIAVFALIISCIGTWISLSESKIMREQHAMMSEEKAASVWPYVEAAQYNDYEDSQNLIIVTYGIKNKGIGPAILNDVIYKLGDEEVESFSLGRTLQKRHPELKIKTIQNQQIDNIVLSKGEIVKVATLKINYEKGKKKEVQKIINSMNFRTLFCYCSVYGDCWKLEGQDLSRSDSCRIREGI